MPASAGNASHQQTRVKERHKAMGWLTESSMYVKEVCYVEKYTMNWIEYTSSYQSSPGKPELFTHLTDLDVDNSSAWDLSSFGRMRWKIENEGFNPGGNAAYRATKILKFWLNAPHRALRGPLLAYIQGNKTD